MGKAYLFANGFARLRDAWAQACGSPARVNARLTRRAGSPRALIGQLGIITTCITIFAPPIIYRRHQRAFSCSSAPRSRQCSARATSRCS